MMYQVFIEDIKLRHLAHILSSVLEKKKLVLIGIQRRVRTQSRKQNPKAFWSAGLWVRDWRVTCFSTTVFVFDSFSSNGVKQNREIKSISKKMVCFSL